MYCRRVRQFVLVYYDNTVNVTRNTTKKGMYYIDNCWHAPPHHNNSPYPVYSIAPVKELSSRRYAPLSWLCSHGKRLPSWARWEGRCWHYVFAVSTELGGDREQIRSVVSQTYWCTWRWSNCCWWQSRRGIWSYMYDQSLHQQCDQEGKWAGSDVSAKATSPRPAQENQSKWVL